MSSFRSDESFQLPPIDIAFIDGSHAYKDVKYDFLRTLEHSHKPTYIFLHDTNIYVGEMLHHAGVKRWLRILKREEEFFEIINFPFSSGVALVRLCKTSYGVHEIMVSPGYSPRPYCCWFPASSIGAIFGSFETLLEIPLTGPRISSPADGTVVYAKVVEPGEEVVTIKQGAGASVNDIVREHLTLRKVLIGIFMSPFDVHFNRAPLSGQIRFIRHYPAVRKNLHMGSMHLRSLLQLAPLYRNSLHIVQNERTVTKIDGEFRGETLSCYVIQIAGGSVRGIDSFFREGERMERGEIFGMIRIGSQVDLVVPSKGRDGNKGASGAESARRGDGAHFFT